jgi:hypothetical protein
LGDHSEAIEIDYDPTRVSYRELLDVFWTSHDPRSPAWSRQYMSAVFYHDEEQRRLAIETRDREAARRRGEIATEIVPASTFTPAEDYHQKYLLRQRSDLMTEFAALYPDPEDFAASTAAARINGYLGGHGNLTALQDEIENLGLSSAGSSRLLRIVRGMGR